MRIYNLTNDVWTLIFDLLEFMHVGRLFQSCHQLQRIILATATVRSVNDTIHSVAGPLPALLYRLPSLSSVSLDIRGDVSLSGSAMLRPGISHPLQLGTGLKKLYLQGGGVYSFLFNEHLSDIERLPNTFHLGTVLPHLETLSISGYLQMTLMLPIIETLPSSLTSLILHNVRGVNLTQFPSLNNLPNLTYFDCFDFTSFKDPTFSFANLEHLSSLHLMRSADDIELPDTLTGSVTLSRLSPALLPKLSRVKKLCIQKGPETILKEAHFFNLVSVSIRSVMELEPIVSMLPSTVTKFRLDDWMQYSHSTDLSILALLPKGLKVLSIGHSGAGHVPFSQFSMMMATRMESMNPQPPALYWLPPGLESLTLALSYYKSLEEGFWTLLPKTLAVVMTKLSLCVDPSRVDETIDFGAILPRATNLVLSSGTGHEHGIDWCIKRMILPSKLTRLEVSYARFSDYHCYQTLLPLPEQTKLSFFEGSAHKLPETLVSLKITDRIFPETLGPLPTGLKTLICDLARQMNGIRYYRGKKEPALQFVDDRFIQSLKTLPPGLEYLSLAIGPLIPTSSELIAALPRTLTSMLVRSLYDFEDQHVPFLPPSLKLLSVNHCQNISDACIKHLPSSITNITWKNNRRLTPASFEDFPPAFYSLSVPKNANFPRALWKQLEGTSRFYMESKKYKY